MDQSRSVEDIFNPELREALKPSQADFVTHFKQLLGKLIVLHSQKEAEAIPDMIYIIEFMERFLSYENIMDIFAVLPEFSNFLIENFFPDVTALIFRAGMFPNQSVLGYTAKYLELYMMLAMKLYREGLPLMIRAVDQVLSPDKSYYIGNNARVDPLAQPFGDQLVDEEESQHFYQSLKSGDLVDAVKSSNNDSKMIWSRAVVTEIKDYNIYVEFVGENQITMKERFLRKAPFQISKAGTRALDFDWRVNLKSGDRADLFLSQKGWLLFEVTEAIEQYDSKDTFKFVRLLQVQSPDLPRAASPDDESSIPFELTVNVHDPALRQPGSYSHLRYVNSIYSNEEIYEWSSPHMFAVHRTKPESILSSDSPYFTNSKFFLRLINIFGMNGGFEMIKKVMSHKDCSPILVGFFLNIVSNCCPYLLGRFMKTDGKDFAQMALSFVLDAPTENIRNLSKEIVESIYKGFEQLAKRIYPQEKAQEFTEHFLLRVATIFISTDNLERKLHGVTILSEIFKKIKSKEFERITRKDLTDLVEKDNILEQLIKGHPQLIAKSVELFKLVFEERTIDNKTLLMLWTNLRKADLETRNVLISMLNDIYFEFSYEHTEFFISRIAEVEPKQIMLDEIEFAFKLVNFSKWRPEAETPEGVPSLTDRVIRIFWKISINEEITNTEVLEKAITKLISLVKYSTKTAEDMKVINEAIENVKDGKAVLQSLKVVKELISLNEATSPEMIKYVVEKEVLRYIFENLASMKKMIREKMEKTGIDMSSLSEATINQHVSTKGFNFEQNILTRLRFIDFIIYGMPKDNERTLSIIKQIWDELVINSLIESETIYFKKWFVKFTGKEAEQFVDSSVLVQFFFDKISLLYDESITNKKELLKTFTEIFYRINLLSGNLVEQAITLEDQYSTHSSESSKTILYVLKTSPNMLEGIDAMWRVMEKTEDDSTAAELIESLTRLYVRTEIDKTERILQFRDHLNGFLERCAGIQASIMAKADWEKDPSSLRSLQRVLMLLIEIVDVSESIYAVANKSLSTFYRGEKVPLVIENNIRAWYGSPKKIELKVFANTTILELKKKIAAEVTKISWKDVKLSRQNRKPEIKEKHNARTLRDMRIKLGEKLISETKPVYQKTPEPVLLEGNILNPRAEAAFREVHRRFAPDGKMGPKDAVNFVAIVLDIPNILPEDSKVKDLFERWDRDRDGYLSEDEFFEFYRTSSMNKTKIVKDNLKALGYGDDLVLQTNDEPYTEEDLARYYLIQNEALISKLFDLAERDDELGKTAWELFVRLPPIPHIIRRLLNFEGLESSGQKNWDGLIETTSVYKTMYYLYIIDYLIEENEENSEDLLSEYIQEDFLQFKRNWRNEFIRHGGFVHLLKILSKYIHRGIKSKVEMTLFNFLMKSVTNYILASVTLKHPHIFRNVAFITTIGLNLQTLIGKKPAEDETDQVKKVIGRATDSSRMPNRQTATALKDDTKKGLGEKSAEEAEKNLQAKLVESEDFIQFRESLRKAEDDSISKLNIEETLSFMATLCENLLSKTGSVEFEEINIVKLSLSIFFSLLLSHTDFLQRAVVTNEVTLLPPQSSFRIPGYSDLVSFFLAGLLTKRNFILVRYFNNAFTVVMRECNSVEVQTILIRAILDHVVRDDLAPRDVARYIELASTILETVCAEERDPKILLNKQDINKIANLETMFFKILDVLLDSKETETAESSDHQSDLLIGYFKILEKILAIEPRLKKELIAQEGKDYLGRIFRECLFNLTGETPAGVSLEDSIKCKNSVTRAACFNFLIETCKGSIPNCSYLVDNGLSELCSRLPMAPGWKYTPAKDKKSPLGFLGIWNLRCICYMNAMLQQFYMTPAFRYSVLAADDQQPPQIAEDKDGRKIDENLLHQLQKLFAYLDKSERSYYMPSEFCFSFKDPTGQPTNVNIQQDTQEFLNIFFERIENLLKPTPFKDIFNNVYGGKTIDLLTCTECGHLRVTEQMFYNLSLEVKNMRNIKESLDKLTTGDTISDFKCENCQKKCDVTKRPLIKDCPNVMIVYLSRMIFDLDVLMNVKINSRYEFQQTLNLKEYTYDHYLYEKNKDEKAAQPSTAAAETEKDQPQQPEAAIKAPLDEDYEYSLAGILVHMGSAEGGHYYSYININRNDPRRSKNDKDEWVEFNDSSIREFKISQMEEECFGSGGPGEKKKTDDFGMDDDLDLERFGILDSMSSAGKSAYILVYEKKKKSNLNFIFTKDQLPLKDKLIEDIVPEEKRAEVVVKEAEDKTLVSIPYYNIKPFIPKHLDQEIAEDNFKFLIEQQVYNKEFVNFITKIFHFSQLPEFDPLTLPNRIYENQIPLKFKELLLKVLKLQMNMFHTILSKTEEIDCTDKFVENMMRIISLCPEYSSEILRHDFFDRLNLVLNMLITCPENKIRLLVSQLVAHVILVNINYFELDIDTDFAVEDAVNEPTLHEDFYEDRNKVMMYLLTRLYTLMLPANQKAQPYKKLEGYFRMWYSLAKNNNKICEWLLKRGCVRFFLDFYMSKNSSAYESRNVYSYHEASLEYALRLSAHLLQYYRERMILAGSSTGQVEPITLTHQENEVVYNQALYDKMMKENYSNNCYKSMKRLLSWVCFGNDMLSTLIIVNVLRNLGYCGENCISYLEALKELLALRDEFADSRRDLIFGVPTVLDDVDYYNQTKFGFQINKSIERPSFTFLTSLKITANVNSFLRSIVECVDKNESTAFIMITFLLQIVNSDQVLFKRLMHYPSPNHLHETFYDWIFSFVKVYLDQEKNAYSGYSMYRQSKLFNSIMKESLIIFEENIHNYVRLTFPENVLEEFKVITNPTSEIFPDQAAPATQDSSSLSVWNSKPCLSFRKNQIIGCVVSEVYPNDFIIEDEESGTIVVRVVEIRARTTPSQSNGSANLALPAAAFTSNRIYETDVNEYTELGKFLDIGKSFLKPNKPSYFGETSYEPHTRNKKTDKKFTLGEADAQDQPAPSAHHANLDFSFGPDDAPESTVSRTGMINKRDEAMNKLKYSQSSHFLKIAVTNNTSTHYGFAIRLKPCEGKPEPNVYFPAHQMNFNVKSEKVDCIVCYLIKVDDSKPFGDFTIELIYSKIREVDVHCSGNTLNFAPHFAPILLNVSKSAEEGLARTKEEVIKGHQLVLQTQLPETFENQPSRDDDEDDKGNVPWDDTGMYDI